MADAAVHNDQKNAPVQKPKMGVWEQLKIYFYANKNILKDVDPSSPIDGFLRYTADVAPVDIVIPACLCKQWNEWVETVPSFDEKSDRVGLVLINTAAVGSVLTTIHNTRQPQLSTCWKVSHPRDDVLVVIQPTQDIELADVTSTSDTTWSFNLKVKPVGAQ